MPILSAAGLIALPTERGQLRAAISAQEGTPIPPEPTPFPGTAAAQPSYDTLRVEEDGKIVPYHVFVDWLPSLVTTPDGGGWIFFGAQARTADGMGPRKLYAGRFDPDLGVWLPATAMPGGIAQFGPAAAVDSAGVVHVVYSDVAEPGELGSTVVHTQRTPDGWSPPTAVAPDPNAGYQMMADIAIDGEDGVHVLWRDQRFATQGERAAHPANGGDLFSAGLVNGKWSAVSKVMERPTPESVAGWPHLTANGSRLVAVWSIYAGTSDEDMESAQRVEWAVKPIAESNWPASKVMIERPSGTRDVGGRLLDVAADATGGVVVVDGSYERAHNDLSLRKLLDGDAGWSEPLSVGAGDYGYLPSVAVRQDATVFVAFNAGRNRNVEIGGIALRPNGTADAPVTFTAAEDGLQVRAFTAVSATGAPWVGYMHVPEGESSVRELRIVREANLLGAL
jgi:hypothetical protein